MTGTTTRFRPKPTLPCTNAPSATMSRHATSSPEETCMGGGRGPRPLAGREDDRLQLGVRVDALGAELTTQAGALEPAERPVEVEDHRRVDRHDAGAHPRGDL